MPTVLTLDSIKFCVYFDDHGLPHVHAIKEDKEAKIEIETGKCVAVNGFSKKDVTKLSKFILTNKDTFLEKWEEYNG